MSEPAKDEADLIGTIAWAIFELNCSADGAAKAALAAIRAAGWAVVPVEPTREMLRAGYEESGGRAVISIWEAMVETAPGGEAMSEPAKDFNLEHWKEVCYAHEVELECLRAENARLQNENASLQTQVAEWEDFVEKTTALISAIADAVEGKP
jgi:hypothetical protein